MPIGILFWMLMILWFLFGLYWNFPASGTQPQVGILGGHLLLFVVIFLLGWKVFGFVLQ